MDKYLNSLTVKSAIPSISALRDVVERRFRRPQDICHYSGALEQEVAARFSQQQESSADSEHMAEVEEIDKTTRSIAETDMSSSTVPAPYYSRNEDILRSLAELKEEVEGSKPENPHNHSNQNHGSSPISKPLDKLGLRMRAETVAEQLLGTEDAGEFLRFLDFYVECVGQILASTTHDTSIDEVDDERVIRAFRLFENDAVRAAEFIEIAQELVDLGFESDRVDSALLLYSNDREAALDFLMK